MLARSKEGEKVGRTAAFFTQKGREREGERGREMWVFRSIASLLPGCTGAISGKSGAISCGGIGCASPPRRFEKSSAPRRAELFFHRKKKASSLPGVTRVFPSSSFSLLWDNGHIESIARSTVLAWRGTTLCEGRPERHQVNERWERYQRTLYATAGGRGKGPRGLVVRRASLAAISK